MIKKQTGAAAMLAVGIFLTTGSGSCATFGDWGTGATNDGQLFAISVNQSGGILMKSCDPSSGMCFWYVGVADTCRAGETVPALLSSSQGAVSLNLTCQGPVKIGSATMYREVISNPDVMDNLLVSTLPLGIAVALQNGAFTVYRFSMSGARQAVEILMQGASKMSRGAPSSTKDSRL
jgi:hypothetical protein